jgi:hypothetical protein
LISKNTRLFFEASEVEIQLLLYQDLIRDHESIADGGDDVQGKQHGLHL